MVVQLVRIPACHAGVAGSSPSTPPQTEAQLNELGFLFHRGRGTALIRYLTREQEFACDGNLGLVEEHRRVADIGDFTQGARGPRFAISAWVSGVSRSDCAPRVTSVGQRIAS